MKMFVKTHDNRYLKVDDIDVVLVDNKEEASDFSNMSSEDFSILRQYIESVYDTELETYFE